MLGGEGGQSLAGVPHISITNTSSWSQGEFLLQMKDLLFYINVAVATYHPGRPSENRSEKNNTLGQSWSIIWWILSTSKLGPGYPWSSLSECSHKMVRSKKSVTDWQGHLKPGFHRIVLVSTAQFGTVSPRAFLSSVLWRSQQPKSKNSSTGFTMGCISISSSLSVCTQGCLLALCNANVSICG